MTSAVIYFSKTGATAEVASEIAKTLDAPSEGIVCLEKRSPFLFVKEIMQVFAGSKPPIRPIKLDVSSFDRIIIGSPIWAGHISSPVTSFLAEYGGGIRSAAAFFTHGTNESYPALFSQFENLLGKPLDATFSVLTSDVRTHAYDLSGFLTALRKE